MANWHGYIGIQDLALTAPQRAEILASLNALGPNDDPQPARLNHWRTRLDGRARIYEALFNEDHLTIASIKQFLANAVGVDPSVISHATSSASYAGGTTNLVVYSAGGTPRIRFALFGGPGSTWRESRDEARGYLLANWADWNEV